MAVSSDLIFDAAVLSSQVYFDDFPASYSDQGGFWNGWRLLSRQELGFNSVAESLLFSNDFLYSFLGAQAFVAVRGTELAIVFRGTQGLADLLVDATLPASILGSFAAVAPLVAAYRDYAVAIGATDAYAFGHSLGGALAEMFMSVSSGNLYSAITFGSPGIPAYFSPIDLRILNISHNQDAITLIPVLTHTGVSVEVELPFINPLTNGDLFSEHYRNIYVETVRLIDNSGLFGLVTNQHIVVLDNSNNGVDFQSESQGIFVMGDDGDDVISGGLGRDLIAGGVGQDVLTGREGSDVLAGGSGADRFFFSNQDVSLAIGNAASA